MIVPIIFSRVLTMSLTGGIVIVLVLVMRLFLARLPKIFSYLLWGVVLLRLLCPVSFSSGLSVFQVIAHAGIIQTQSNEAQALPLRFPTVNWNADSYADTNANNTSVFYVEGKTGSNANPMTALDVFYNKKEADMSGHDSPSNVQTVCAAVWLLGSMVLWLYSIVSIIRLKRQLIGTVPDQKSTHNNIYLCDYIHTAFVMGVLRPRIYLPTTLTETERHYILLHEQTHIRRGDHVFRLLAFLALSLHWFNPLVWCAFFLSEKDMEMSCDEAVMRQMGTDLRAAYSASLLNLASGKKVFAGAPLGFGEGSVKSRIKNIMRYQKTAVFVAVPGFVLVGIVLVALASNPARDSAVSADGNQNEEESRDSWGTHINEKPRGEDWHRESAADEQKQNAASQASSGAAEAEGSGERMMVSPAVVTDQMVCDIDGPVLDYADHKTLIFHHNFGLFIYNIGENRLDSTVNLKELGCLDAKGQLNCEIFVTEDGQRVDLHPLDTDRLYVYNVTDRRLTQEAYDGTYYEEHNMDFFVSRNQTKNCVYPDYTVWRSKDCVPLSGSQTRYLYLESGSGMVMDLYYMVEAGDGDGERVQFAKIFGDEIALTQGGGLFAYASYTGYMDECAAWDGYGQFVNRDYDGDGRRDRVYRANIGLDDMCTYRIEFGNGDVIETKRLGMGIPEIQTCDLNGDGVKEILIQLSYGFSTDPNANGEMALFEKKNGRYEPLMPPEELYTSMNGNESALQDGSEMYRPSITVVCKELGDEFPAWASMPENVDKQVPARQLTVQVKELTGNAAIEKVIPLKQEAAYLLEGAEDALDHQSVSYKTEIVNDGERDLLAFYFEAVNKWYLDEIVVTAAYENGALHVVGSRYVSEADME